MGVLGIAPYYRCEVTDCVIVVLNHLVTFSSFVKVPDVARHPVDAATEGPNRLLKLLHSSVREAYVVVDIGLVSQKRPV